MRNAYSDVFDNFIKYYLVVLFSAKEKHFSRISKNPIDFIFFYEIHLFLHTSWYTSRPIILSDNIGKNNFDKKHERIRAAANETNIEIWMDGVTRSYVF